MKIPDELKIKPVGQPDLQEFSQELTKRWDEQLQEERQSAASVQLVKVLPPSFIKALLVIANNAWRMRSKLVNGAPDEPRTEISKEDVKKLGRYAEAFFEALTSLGFEVKDRTGETFDYGMPEKVVAAQPQGGLAREQVVETIRPTVYWQNQIVQLGEVVIATPAAGPQGENKTYL
jgi:hypothetical protein